MAGFIVKSFDPIANVATTSANIDVFTVPAGHVYMLKCLDMKLVAANSTATTAKAQISESTGTTFYQATETFSTSGVTGEVKYVSLGLGMDNGASQSQSAGSSTQNSSRSVVCSMHRAVFTAGQILRVVKTAGSSGTPTLNIFCSVIDYTL